ncbi:ABC transporter ATP-binding protein [Pseudomonas sp. 21LCFQ02]|uniref:ABC transporter ATP-binding protein n=1 Tax=Pseudomonas sp. 21LCFQ02 TaxID=2957505 RepID=UPI00209A9174|nr:ABC transporter ATP-binding protein [Pseudomonas sp. 21LCFQ02]MCO8167517.1 ABC transporter ATP-binding protein [Pseudomonas sp. 21LCFQ02]
MLEIRHITKSFTGHPVLHDLSLDIGKGEIFTLLGASGCGKTTLLRILAGLETADQGQLYFDGQTWVDRSHGTFVAPQQRGIGLVFQSYAVWPHLSVFDNVAYPLRNRKIAREQIQEKVMRTLHSVGLGGLAQRAAHQLSGGQQQRVAMARALVGDPALLLLDEPFSNLDVGLRKQLRQELKDLQKRLGLTVVLVTHDQDDAFALSDRIAVLKDGRVEQIGTAEQIHNEPATAYVQGFIGRGSQLQAHLTSNGEFAALGGIEVKLAVRVIAPNRAPLALWVRPESVTLNQLSQPGIGLQGQVSHSVFAGDRYETYVRLSDQQQLMAFQSHGQLSAPGSWVGIEFSSLPHASILNIQG